MLVLALDSSTRTGSVALARHGELLDTRLGDASVRHAERLPGDLVALLEAHGATLADVDLLAVTAGPGGFTGLRVGLATIQGLAMALGRRVFVASTLELLAWAGGQAEPHAAYVGAWMRGMRGEIFTAVYAGRAAAGAAPVAVVAPFVGTPPEAVERWRAAALTGPIAVVGDAWPEESAALVSAFGPQLVPCRTPPLAAVLAIEAGVRAGEAVTAAAVRPAYVRRPDAVITRELAGLPAPGAE